jgi:polysaccharide deacetylase 2 family uncharacterized protein YibQ
MAGKRASRSPSGAAKLPRISAVAIWAPLAALLALGATTTVLDLLALPEAETLKANENRQRAVIDPATGVVSIGIADGGVADSKFDVGTPEEPAPVAPTEPSAEEPKPAEPVTPETPTETPATEPAAEPAPETPTEATPATEEPKPAEPVTPPTAEPAPATQTTPATDGLPADAPSLRTEPIGSKPSMPEYSRDSLVGAPAPEITETIDTLRLPKRGLKDATASRIYAQPFKRKPEQVLLTFVVMDVGLDEQTIGMLLDLPKEVTIAYSPYARNAATYAEMFRRSGHELWTVLPAMGDRYPSDDPGPMGLIARMPAEELVRRLREVMGAVMGSVGLILPPDEALSSEKESMSTVLTEISARGLFLFSTHPTHSVEHIAPDPKMQAITRRADLILDSTPNEAQIKSKLAGLLASATEKGEYVVVLDARPQSIALLRDWLKETKIEAPITLAPLSGFYQLKAEPLAEEAKDDGHGAPAKKEDDGHGAPAKKDDGHGSAEKPKPKPKPAPKKPKVLPQDKYKQPEKKSSGGGH